MVILKIHRKIERINLYIIDIRRKSLVDILVGEYWERIVKAPTQTNIWDKTDNKISRLSVYFTIKCMKSHCIYGDIIAVVLAI